MAATVTNPRICASLVSGSVKHAPRDPKRGHSESEDVGIRTMLGCIAMVTALALATVPHLVSITDRLSATCIVRLLTALLVIGVVTVQPHGVGTWPTPASPPAWRQATEQRSSTG